MKLLKKWLGFDKALSIFPPLCIWEQGKRPNNEDAIFPSKGTATPADRLFLVLDGVGGAAMGEIASSIACEQLVTFFEKHKNQLIDEPLLKKAIYQVQLGFDTYISQHPQAAGMGTTFTIVQLHENSAVIAHLGDSRAYHIRDGIILFRTKDHTLANALVEEKVITAEQVATHRGRNIIDSLQASNIAQAPPDLHTIRSGLKRGDYFFLCTDGILEGITEEYLLRLLNDKSMTNQKKIMEIKSQCIKYSKDNYTAYLIEIG